MGISYGGDPAPLRRLARRRESLNITGGGPTRPIVVRLHRGGTTSLASGGTATPAPKPDYSSGANILANSLISAGSISSAGARMDLSVGRLGLRMPSARLDVDFGAYFRTYMFGINPQLS